MSAAGFYIATESTKGRNTKEARKSAQGRKGQLKKADAISRVEAVDLKHSYKLDRSEAQRKERRAKRNK